MNKEIFEFLEHEKVLAKRLSRKTPALIRAIKKDFKKSKKKPLDKPEKVG